MPVPFILAVLCLFLIGCTSKGVGLEEILAQPSPETTGSISRPAMATPPATVGSASDQGSEPQPVLAMAPVAAITVPGSPESGLASVARPATLMVPSIPRARPERRSRIYRPQFGDAKPINFGRNSPKSLAVHGVDVSRWQGEIDWAKLRSHGANFAYIKATDGADHLDPMFRKNWEGAAAAGLKRGAYHFFYWCRTGSEQADWFIRNVPREPGALPPVIDVEWNGQSRCKKRPARDQVLAKMQAFMDKIERHYGQRPIIYTAPDFYRDNLKSAFLDYPFWLRSVAAHPSKVYPGRKWVFWQFSGTGLSRGVKGKIDLNVFHGSVEDWHRWTSQQSS